MKTNKTVFVCFNLASIPIFLKKNWIFSALLKISLVLAYKMSNNFPKTTRFKFLLVKIYQRVVLERSESLKSPHKLVIPENVLISAFYTVILCEMCWKVAKLFNLAQIWTCRPLIRRIIHQRVMLKGPESPKGPHKLVLPENVADSNINWTFLCD